jgi:hypothetical protein
MLQCFELRVAYTRGGWHSTGNQRAVTNDGGEAVCIQWYL